MQFNLIYILLKSYIIALHYILLDFLLVLIRFLNLEANVFSFLTYFFFRFSAQNHSAGISLPRSAEEFAQQHFQPSNQPTDTAPPESHPA